MHHLDLATIHLAGGAHRTREEGTCLLEATAWWADEPHTDAPACVSKVLQTFGTRLNDILPDDKRQELKPLIPAMVGTAGDGHDEARSYMALDWLIRTYTPAWLDLAGLTAEATALRDLRRIADLAAAQAAGPVVRVGRDKAAAAAAAWAAAAAAAWAAAWAAARGAAWAAAGDAAWDAAWAAARDAARGAARGAARAAARGAAWDAAGDAARAAARAAAGDAARGAAGDAARAAAWGVLQPTVDQLQTSAIGLFTTMIRPLAVK